MSSFPQNYLGSNGFEFMKFNTEENRRDLVFHEDIQSLNTNSVLFRSWQRSRDYKVASDIGVAPWIAYEPKTDAEMMLLALGKQYLNYYRHILDTCDCIFALANSEGVLIHTVIPKTRRKSAEKHNFLANSLWDEKKVGTNAISMVLEEKKHIYMQGYDFYSSAFWSYGCIASPIYGGQNGDVIGVLCLGGSKKSINMYSLGWNVSLAKTIENELGKRIIQHENQGNPSLRPAKSNISHSMGLPGVIGKDPAFLDVLRMAGKAATTDMNILLTGETGTGKEVVAKAIHMNSNRATEPFVAVNCGSIPKELLYSELFGYKEGAFTGASRQGYLGRFEQADGGTLFLDEIGDAPHEVQIALLRVLEERVVNRLGAVNQTPVNVRILAATSRELKSLVQDGTFRIDLYYRLSGININIPPLRKRKEDILFLAEHFLQTARERSGLFYRFDDELVKAFLEYDWPGNVRELKNTVDRLSVFAEDEQIGINSFNNLMFSTEKKKLCCSKSDLKKEAFMRQLKESKGNMSKVAKKFGVNRATVYRWLEKYEIDKEQLIWSK